MGKAEELSQADIDTLYQRTLALLEADRRNSKRTLTSIKEAADAAFLSLRTDAWKDRVLNPVRVGKWLKKINQEQKTILAAFFDVPLPEKNTPPNSIRRCETDDAFRNEVLTLVASGKLNRAELAFQLKCIPSEVGVMVAAAINSLVKEELPLELRCAPDFGQLIKV